MTPDEYKKLALDDSLYKALEATEKAKFDLIDAEIDAEITSYLQFGTEPTEVQIEEIIERKSKEVSETYEVPPLTSAFGDFEESKYYPGVYRIAEELGGEAEPPINIPPTPDEPQEPTLLGAVSPQQFVPEPRASGGIEIRTTIDQASIQTDLEAALGAEEAQRTAPIINTIYLNEIAQNPQLDPVATLDKIYKEINSISDVEMKEIKLVDDDSALTYSIKDPLIQAFGLQVDNPTYPDYSPIQLAFVQSNIDSKFRKREAEIAEELSIAPAIDYVTVTTTEGRFSLPKEIVDYIRNTDERIADEMYTPKVDRLIREAKAVSSAKQTKVSGEISGTDIETLAKLRAIQATGGDAWWLDDDKKAAALADPESFVEQGYFTDVSKLGGTRETVGSWGLRAALSPINALAGAAYEYALEPVGQAIGGTLLEGAELVGAVPPADYYALTAKDLRAQERAETTPLYKNSPVLANIALGKGITGEVVDLTNELSNDGWIETAMIGSGFATDLLSPDFAIAMAAAKLPLAAAGSYKLQKSIYGSGNIGRALKDGTKATAGFLLDDFNFITRAPGVSKSAKIGAERFSHGDVRLLFADDLAKEMRAKTIVDTASDKAVALTRLQQEGLSNTSINKLVNESGNITEAQSRIPSEAFTGNAKAQALVDEAAKSQRYLDNLQDGYKAARADTGANVNVKAVDDLVKTATGKSAKSLKAGDLAADVIGNISKSLDTQYARALLFEVAPDLKAVDNVIAVTRSTWTHPDNIEELVNRALKTEVGEVAKNISSDVVVGTARIGRKTRPVGFELAQKSERPVVGSSKFLEGSIETFYKVSQSLADELKVAIKDINIPPAQKRQISANLESGEIFADDLRLIIDTNIDDVARLMQSEKAIITAEDVSRLPKKQQELYLEAAGTRGRITDFFASTKNAFTSVANKMRGRQVTPSGKQPSYLTLEQRRLVSEIQQEASALDTTMRRDIKGLMSGDEELLSQYGRPGTIIDKPQTKEEALGILIVGNTRNDVAPGMLSHYEGGFYSAAANKKENLRSTLDWGLRRLFFTEEVYESAIDRAQGIKSIYANDILNTNGVALAKSTINKAVQQMADNPNDYWNIYAQLIEDYKDIATTQANLRPGVKSADIADSFVNNFQEYKQDLLIGSYYNIQTNRLIATKTAKVLEREIDILTPAFDTLIDDLVDLEIGGLGRKQFKGLKAALPEIVKNDIANAYGRTPSFTQRAEAVSTAVINELLKDTPAAAEELKLINKFKQDLEMWEIDDMLGAFTGPKPVLSDYVSPQKAEAVDILLTTVDDTTRIIIDISDNYARKRGLANPSSNMDLQQMNAYLEGLFDNTNKGLVREVMGPQFYDELSSAALSGRNTLLTNNLDKAIRAGATGDGNFMQGFQKLLNFINSTRYTLLLGSRLRFHGANVSTANLITYSTVGKIARPDDMYNAMPTVFSAPGGRNWNKIAVVDPSGKIYTHGELQKELLETGVRSEFNFVTSVLNDGRLKSWLRQNGIPDRISIASQVLEQATVQEDLIFRAAILQRSLKEGASLEEGLALARRSLFDYNDMSPAEKAIAANFFIFYSFARQNFVANMNNLSSISGLKRTVNILKFDRDWDYLTEKLGGETYDPSVFFPEYAQNRLTLAVSKNQPKNWYLMSPPIPTVDAYTMAAEIASISGIPRLVGKQLNPQYKKLLGLEPMIGGQTKVNKEYASLINWYVGMDDPQANADFIQRLVGGSVIPVYAKPENGGVGKSGATFVYPLDKAQQKLWNIYVQGIDFVGLGAPLKDYTKFFGLTEGTAYGQGPSWSQITNRLGVTTPMLFPSQQQQDIYQLYKRSGAMRDQKKLRGKVEKGLDEQMTEEILREQE